MSEYKKISSYRSYEESPFINEVINIDISERKRYLHGKKTDTLINNATGEVVGEEGITAIFEKVDREKFTKIYKSGLAEMYKLSKCGLKMFDFIAAELRVNKDFVYILPDAAKSYTGYSSAKSINKGIGELIESNFIAKSNSRFLYYINPMMFFNGDRYTIVRQYTIVDKPTEEKIEADAKKLLAKGRPKN